MNHFCTFFIIIGKIIFDENVVFKGEIYCDFLFTSEMPDSHR